MQTQFDHSFRTAGRGEDNTQITDGHDDYYSHPDAILRYGLFRELWSRTEILARVPAVTVSVKTDFFSQIRFGDEICVVTEAEKIGHKSFTLLQRIMRGEQECSRSRTVMVVFDKERQLSLEVPEEWRRILDPIEK